MSSPSTGPRPRSNHRRRQSPVLSIVLVVVGMVVLFAAGFGLSVIIRGASSGGDAAPTTGPTNASPTPLPCVTVTVTPGAGLPSPSQVTTNVYNATDRAGLAASTAEVLQARGFVVSTIANDPLAKTITGVAELRYGPSGETGAQLLAYYFPGALLVEDDRTDATVDVALGASFTEVPPQSEIDAALASPSPSPSGPGCSPSAIPATDEPTGEVTGDATDEVTEPSPEAS